MGKRVFVSLLEYIAGGVTAVLSLICSISFLTFYIHPSKEVFFQWIGLLLPALLLLNAGLLLFWIIRRKRWFWFPLFALLANFWYYPSVFQLSVFDADIENSPNNIVVATFNVHFLAMTKFGDPLLNIARLAEEKQIDLLCMQEIPLNLSKDSLQRIFPSMPYVAVAGSPNDAFGIMMLSKFPIVKSEVISFTERPNCALKVDLNIRGKDVALFNCHLQTTNWNQRNLLQIDKTQPYNEMKSLLMQKKVMEDNFIIRAHQADSISKRITNSHVPVVVCGDFNDTPDSYVYYRMKADLVDSFHTSGKGYSYTYKYIGKILRIDYLFYSPDTFDGIKYESPNVNFSDHNPVIVTLKLKS